MASASKTFEVVSKKQKLYRHSTTFYRKLKVLRFHSKIDSINVNSDFGVVKPSLRSIYHNSSSNPSVAAVVDETNIINEDYNDFENEGDFNYSIQSYVPENSSIIEDDEERNNSLLSQISLAQELRTWYHCHRISHSSFDHLLRILKSNGMNLPIDSRTLLKTPRIVQIQTMGNGEFWYNGIKNCLNTAYSEIDKPVVLPLVFNVDGLPPFNSSPLEFWPILFKIENMNLKPMVVAIYCGETKPPLQEFLYSFVEELNDILQNGFYVNGYKIEIVIKYFVCDTPARNFIKGRDKSSLYV